MDSGDHSDPFAPPLRQTIANDGDAELEDGDEDSSDSGDSTSSASNSQSATRQGDIQYSENTLKRHQQFVESAVGDKVVFKLSGLYSLANTENKTAPEQKILQDHSVTAKIVFKDSECVVLKICGLQMHLRITSAQFTGKIAVWTSRVHLSRKAMSKLSLSRDHENRAKYKTIMKLIRHSTFFTEWSTSGTVTDMKKDNAQAALSGGEDSDPGFIQFNSRSEAKLVKGELRVGSVDIPHVNKKSRGNDQPPLPPQSSSGLSPTCKPIASVKYLPPPHVVLKPRGITTQPEPTAAGGAKSDLVAVRTVWGREVAPHSSDNKRKVYQGSSSEDER
eukprot:gene28383-35228_t